MTVPLQQDRNARNGFTLVELLLAVTLLAGLIGAVAFGFSNLHRSAQLDEGVERIETALRFARAHAASTGHKVQVVLAPTPPAGTVPAGLPGTTGTSSPASASAGTAAPGSVEAAAGPTPLRIEWEPDPVRAPGVFEPVATLSTDVTDVSDLVEVRAVEREVPGAAAAPSADSGDPARDGSGTASTPNAGANAATLASIPMVDESSEPASASAADPMKPAAITFYPDGSCDGATIVLASRDTEDAREVAVRVQGVTGTTRREWRETAGSAWSASAPSAMPSRPANATPASLPAPSPASSASARRP